MLCVIAKIDEAAADRLRQLQRVGEVFGIAPRHLYGHVTLATFIAGDERAQIARCRKSLSGLRAFGIRYADVLWLPATGIVVAAPLKEGTLRDVQARLAEADLPALDQWTRPEIWQPHTTLIHRIEADLEPVTQAMRQAFRPIEARVRRIEFSRVTEKGYEIVDAVELAE